MTLQLVDISALGIVCAADSTITFRKENAGKITKQESWPKLLRVDRLSGMIGYYGYALVGDQKIPDWLEAFIRHSQANSIGEFALELQDNLNIKWPRPVGDTGTGFHLAGYTLFEQINVPCFYHIWNHNGVDGGYKVVSSGFRAHSDFLERDVAHYLPDRLDEFFKEKYSRVYRNGALSRYNELAESLYDFTKKSWAKGLIKQPKKIEDWAWYYRFQLETVKQMYRYLLHEKHPPIGREINIYTIAPTGVIKKLPNKPS